MAQEIYPTENDVGGDGKGRYTTETTWGRLFGLVSGSLARHGGVNWVQQGLTVTTPSASQADIAAGDCVINGYQVHTTTSSSVSLTDNATNSIYLTLSRSGGKVTGQIGAVQTGTTVPDDSVILARVVVASAAVQSNTDMRPRSSSGKWGSYTGSGSGATQSVILGFRPTLVIITSNGTDDVFAVKFDGGSWAIFWDNVGGIKLASAAHESPSIQTFGFNVGHSIGNPSLNTGSETYQYIALGP